MLVKGAQAWEIPIMTRGYGAGSVWSRLGGLRGSKPSGIVGTTKWIIIAFYDFLWFQNSTTILWAQMVAFQQIMYPCLPINFMLKSR